MDDLDRLFVEFVEVLRRERPKALKEPVTVLEMHDQIIPYRRVRNPVGFRSNDDYEVTLCRLLSGERGYLLADHEMQQELRAGLEESLPDNRRYLAFPDVRVWLNPEEIPPPGDIRYAPPEIREQLDWRSVDDEEEAEERLSSDELESAAADAGVAAGLESDEDEAAEIAPEVEEGTVCTECNAELTRPHNYCPFCGCPLSAAACAICGTLLQTAWRFCPDCGAPRTSGLSE